MEFLKKNAGLIIFVLILGFVVWYFFLRKKKSESSYRVASAVKAIGCPEWQTWNPITKRCENRSYAAQVVPSKGTGLGRKCFCGMDDSTPPREVWNFTCCNKATA